MMLTLGFVEDTAKPTLNTEDLETYDAHLVINDAVSLDKGIMHDGPLSVRLGALIKEDVSQSLLIPYQ